MYSLQAESPDIQVDIPVPSLDTPSSTHFSRPGRPMTTRSRISRTIVPSWFAMMAVGLVAVGYAQAAGQKQPPLATPSLSDSSQRTLIDRYCVTCHNQRLKTAGLMLDTMDVAKVSDRAELWEKVVRKL